MSKAATFQEAVTTVLGSAPEFIEPGRLYRFSINGKRSDTAGWCRLFDDGRAGVFGDFRNGVSEVWTAHVKEGITPFEKANAKRLIAESKRQREHAQAQAWAKARISIASTWRAARSVTQGDPVWRYLSRRLVADVIDVPQCIRFHPSMAYHHDGSWIGNWPAMIAPITGNDGEIKALHRTYLTDDGCKAAVPGSVKKLTPACAPLFGAAIRLAGPSLGIVGVAEGIETAWAASLSSGLPTMAAYSATALESFLWPRGLKQLVVFADNDDAGLKASAALRDRAASAGLNCKVLIPTGPGADWCDVWASRAEVCQ